MFGSSHDTRYEKIQQETCEEGYDGTKNEVAEATQPTEILIETDETDSIKEHPDPLSSKLCRCVALPADSSSVPVLRAPENINSPSPMPSWSVTHTANAVDAILESLSKNNLELSIAVEAETDSNRFPSSQPTAPSLSGVNKFFPTTAPTSQSKNEDEQKSGASNNINTTAHTDPNSTMITKSGHILTFAPWFNEWQVKVWDSKPDKPLQFIHITKTGGTTVEDIANMSSYTVKWGRLNFRKYGWWHRLFTPADEEMQAYLDNLGRTERWHLTTPEAFAQFKQNHHFFTIVRNPYDRLISEFHCRWGGMGRYPRAMRKMTKYERNRFIQEKIGQRSIVRGGHYSEMVRYIDLNLTIHVLKFETLEADLRDLWLKYNLTELISIMEETHHRSQIPKAKVFDRSSFGNRSLSLIRDVYRDDFEWFGYDIDDLSERRYLGETPCLFEC